MTSGGIRRGLASRNPWRSDPQIADARDAITTSPGPGVGIRRVLELHPARPQVHERLHAPSRLRRADERPVARRHQDGDVGELAADRLDERAGEPEVAREQVVVHGDQDAGVDPGSEPRGLAMIEVARRCLAVRVRRRVR